MEKKVPVKRVKDLLRECGIPRNIIRAPDRTYVLPTREYLLRRFSRSLRAHLVRYGVLDYRSGVNDCDDFARYACAHAAMVHRRNDLKKRKGKNLPAIAVAEIWYTDEVVGKHATFVALIGKKEVLRLDRVRKKWRGRMITRIQELPISKKELQTVFYCRLG
ncbi:MAG: hypothetical protein QF645_04485 [Planctomycetota bacterium]|nr:hypothetical protein [Planctomycetota bacterium]